MSIIYKEGGIFLNILYFIRGKGVFVIFTEHQEQLKKLFDNKSQLDRFWSFVLFDQVILNMFWKPGASPLRKSMSGKTEL